MQKVHAENKELFELMSNHTGKNITTVQDMDFTLDVLFIEVRKLTHIIVISVLIICQCGGLSSEKLSFGLCL